MQLPQKRTKLRKLIDAMPKDGTVSKGQAASLMESVGYDLKLVDRTLTYLQTMGYFVRAGSRYALSGGVLKNFAPQAEVISQYVDNFKPLRGYDAMMRRGRDLRVWHSVPCAARCVPLGC